MESATMVMYTGIITWAAIGLYIFWLCRKQIHLSQRIDRMTQLMEDKE